MLCSGCSPLTLPRPQQYQKNCIASKFCNRFRAWKKTHAEQSAEELAAKKRELDAGCAAEVAGLRERMIRQGKPVDYPAKSGGGQRTYERNSRGEFAAVSGRFTKEARQQRTRRRELQKTQRKIKSHVARKMLHDCRTFVAGLADRDYEALWSDAELLRADAAGRPNISGIVYAHGVVVAPVVGGAGPGAAETAHELERAAGGGREEEEWYGAEEENGDANVGYLSGGAPAGVDPGIEGLRADTLAAHEDSPEVEMHDSAAPAQVVRVDAVMEDGQTGDEEEGYPAEEEEGEESGDTDLAFLFGEAPEGVDPDIDAPAAHEDSQEVEMHALQVIRVDAAVAARTSPESLGGDANIAAEEAQVRGTAPGQSSCDPPAADGGFERTEDTAGIPCHESLAYYWEDPDIDALFANDGGEVSPADADCCYGGSGDVSTIEYDDAYWSQYAWT